MRFIFLSLLVLTGLVHSQQTTLAQDIKESSVPAESPKENKPNEEWEDNASKTKTDTEHNAKDEVSGPTLSLDGLDLEALVEGGDPVRQVAPVSVDGSDDDDHGTSAGIERPAQEKESFSESVSDIAGKVTIGGYGQHEFFAGENEVAGFRNHRFVLFVSSQLTKRMSIAAEIEWEYAGSPMKRDGNLGYGEVLLEYAVVDFKFTSWLIFRAGIILVPNVFNIRHDAPLRQLVDRPIALTTIIPTTWFESGAGFHGNIHLGDGQRMNYELYVVNGLDARIFDGLGFRAARGSHFEDNNHDKAITGRVAWQPSMGLEFGVFGYTGAYDKRKNRVNMVAGDVTARFGPVELLGEFIWAWIDPGFIEGFSPSSPANTRDAVPESMMGFYGQINYEFQIELLNRILPEDLAETTFAASLRYEGKDTNTEEHTAIGDLRRLTVGLNVRPIPYLVWKLNLQWNTQGKDYQHGAPELWNRNFWAGRKAFFLPDRFISSIAYQF